MGSKSPQPHSQESALEMRLARAESEGQLNSRRITLLRSILDNSEETYFLSSRELAKRYGVDIATVVRTTQALGYERFADFGADLRKHFVMRITPYRAMKTATEEGRTPADHIANSVQRDLENITQLRSRINVDQLLEMAKQIRRARRVLIVGLDFAASLAWCLDYHLTVIGVHSEAPVGTTGNLHYKLRSLNSKDLLIAISFGRCLRETVNAAIEARSRGVAAVGITDTQLSPIARYCDSYLLVSVASPSLAASYAAAMALVNALVTACAHISPKRSLQVMAQSEKDYFSSDRWFQENPRRAINGNRKNRQ